MTMEEAERYAGWIQRGFPHMKMEPRLYIRALVHYDAALVESAILDAIESEWKHLPKVAEVTEVLQRAKLRHPSTVHCETCDGDRLVRVGKGTATGDGEYAPCPDCHPMSGKNYLSYSSDLQPLDPAKVREMSKA